MRYLYRLLQTIIYLKLSQIYFRLLYKVTKPKIKIFSSPELRNRIAKLQFPRYLFKTTADGQKFTFLNHESELGNIARASKLWRYNYHYNDALNSIFSGDDFEVCRKIIDDWILGNTDIHDEGWEPFCISLRSVNWIKLFSKLDQNQIKNTWIESLALQLNVLEQRIEYHILANHLMANAKALIFGGLYFGGENGDRWLALGVKILEVEIEEQFLCDGAHFELSPMYHAIMMWDLADIIYLHNETQLNEMEKLADILKEKFYNGFVWLSDMTHPDGELSFFNDSVFSNAPNISDLRKYAEILRIDLESSEPKKCLFGKLNEQSGYGIVEWRSGHKLIVDVAEIGPSYQPGHAHADTLSCELSLFGQRIFVNSGISTYEMGHLRNTQRSTASHNTIVIDNVNSSDVWASFRVAKRAKPLGVNISKERNKIEIQGCHDGYNKWYKNIIHRRTWVADTGSLVIQDELRRKNCLAVAHWHFHPSVQFHFIDENVLKLDLLTGQSVKITILGARLELQQYYWSPEFGSQILSHKLLLNLLSNNLTTQIEWLDR